MSEGKVEISIDKWDQIRDDNSRLLKDNQDLMDSVKTVKITIASKELMGNFKYDRWLEKNIFVDESKDIEKVEYMNISDLEEILRKEAEDLVKNDLIEKDNKIKNLEKKIKDAHKDFMDKRMLDVLDNDNKISKIERKYKNSEKSIQSNNALIVKDYKIKIEELEKENLEFKNDNKNKIKDVKIKELEKDLKDSLFTINTLNIKIEELEKTNMALLKRIPFWKRNK